MGWDFSVYIRSRVRKRAKVREIAAKMAPSYEGELYEPDEDEVEEEGEESDDSFDLGFTFGKRGGRFSVERLKSGFRFFTDNVLAGNASEDIGGLMGLIGSKLGTVLDCGIRTIPIAETGGWRSPKPEHGDHRNRPWRSPKPGIPITETGDGDRLS